MPRSMVAGSAHSCVDVVATALVESWFAQPAVHRNIGNPGWLVIRSLVCYASVRIRSIVVWENDSAAMSSGPISGTSLGAASRESVWKAAL